MRHHLITTITLCCIAVPATPAAADVEAGDRVGVCAAQAELNREPNHGWDGTLTEGESFRVRKRSDSGKYAYGFAYGHINRLGWVRSDALCGTAQARAAAADRFVGERVRVCAASTELNREPNEGWDGLLSAGESFHVRRLSDSGRYAHGLAYGNINRVGWIRTASLCGAERYI
jgi:hypothetical protein